MDYSLEHSTSTKDELKKLNIDGEISIELLCGLIKIGGKAIFDSQEESGKKIEKLTCRYYSELFSVDLTPGAKQVLDKDIVEKLLKSEIKATHFVKRVTLGAIVNASIRIESVNKKKKTDFQGNLSFFIKDFWKVFFLNISCENRL
jgi:hypothetical protein